MGTNGQIKRLIKREREREMHLSTVDRIRKQEGGFKATWVMLRRIGRPWTHFDTYLKECCHQKMLNLRWLERRVLLVLLLPSPEVCSSNLVMGVLITWFLCCVYWKDEKRKTVKEFKRWPNLGSWWLCAYIIAKGWLSLAQI